MAIEIEIESKKFVIPESKDPCAIWVGYFDSLQQTIGKTNARMIWLLTWKTNGSPSCLTRPNFNTWMQKQGIDVSNAATRALADASQIGSNFMGMGKNLSKVLVWVVPALLLSVVISVVVVLVTSSKKATLTDLSQLTPMGRAVQGGVKLLGR